jgi:hypothetical protein
VKKQYFPAGFVVLFCLVSAVSAQRFSHDTSWVKPRGQQLFIGNSKKPLVRLYDPQFNVEDKMDPHYGTFLPQLSVSADSSKAVILIRHAKDSHAYAAIDVTAGNWQILGGEASAVYWSPDYSRAAIYEHYLSELQKIRVIDFAAPITPYTVPDVIKPSAMEGNRTVLFKNIRWRSNAAVEYAIVTTDSAGVSTQTVRVYEVPKAKKK